MVPMAHNRQMRIARRSLARGVGSQSVILSLLTLVGLAAGCGTKIGDPCERAFDCSVTQNRQCDVSNADRDPNNEGECTIENCIRNGCPKEAVCVKVYPTEFLSTTCDPEQEDLVDGVNACSAQDLCLPEGLCADELTARSSCRLECTKDSDCRSNYECRPLGQDGMYRAPDPDTPRLEGGKSICVPRP